MGIKRQKASVIMQSLLIDLAATGANDALAIVRRACMQPNIRLAQDEDQANIGSRTAQIGKDISSIDSMITTAAATGAPTSNVHNARKHINALKSLFDGGSFESALAQAQRMSSDAFVEGEAFGTSLFATWGGGSEVDIELIFDEEFPTTERPQTEAYKKIINRVISNLRHIIDHQGAAPAAAPAADPAAAPDLAALRAVFVDNIEGGAKKLDAFFEKYATGKVSNDVQAIIKAEILENADVQKLNLNFDKKSDEAYFRKLLLIPDFTNKSKALHDKVVAQIDKASKQIDAATSNELL